MREFLVHDASSVRFPADLQRLVKRQGGSVHANFRPTKISRLCLSVSRLPARPHNRPSFPLSLPPQRPLPPHLAAVPLIN